MSKEYSINKITLNKKSGHLNSNLYLLDHPLLPTPVQVQGHQAFSTCVHDVGVSVSESEYLFIS